VLLTRETADPNNAPVAVEFQSTAELLRLVSAPGADRDVALRAKSTLLARYAYIIFEELAQRREQADNLELRSRLVDSARAGLTKAVDSFRSGYLTYSSNRQDVDSLIGSQIEAEFKAHATAIVHHEVRMTLHAEAPSELEPHREPRGYVFGQQVEDDEQSAAFQELQDLADGPQSAKRNISEVAREGLRRRRKRRRQRLRQRQRLKKLGALVADELVGEVGDDLSDDLSAKELQDLDGGSATDSSDDLATYDWRIGSDHQPPFSVEVMYGIDDERQELSVESMAENGKHAPGYIFESTSLQDADEEVDDDDDNDDEVDDDVVDEQAAMQSSPARRKSRDDDLFSTANPLSVIDFAPPKPEPSALDRMLDPELNSADYSLSAGFSRKRAPGLDRAARNGTAKGYASNEKAEEKNAVDASQGGSRRRPIRDSRRSAQAGAPAKTNLQLEEDQALEEENALNDLKLSSPRDAGVDLEKHRAYRDLVRRTQNNYVPIQAKSLLRTDADAAPPARWLQIQLNDRGSDPFHYFKVNANHVEPIFSIAKNRKFRNDQAMRRQWLLNWLRVSMRNDFVPSHLASIALKYRSIRRARKGTGQGRDSEDLADALLQDDVEDEAMVSAAAATAEDSGRAAAVGQAEQSLHDVDKVEDLGAFVEEAVLQRFKAQQPRILVIGDVHGCVDELCMLLKGVDFSPGDLVLFLGDLTAKGPDSVAVVRLARQIGALGVRGNHDFEVIKWIEALRKCPSKPTKLDASEHTRIAAKLVSQDAAWLKSCPWYIHSPDLEMYFVHAGEFLRDGNGT